jgi:hypothetical protein
LQIGPFDFIIQKGAFDGKKGEGEGQGQGQEEEKEKVASRRAQPNAPAVNSLLAHWLILPPRP